MTWICTNCNREFRNTNQWHSCAQVDLKHHLRNKSPEVRATLEKLLREVHKFGNISVDPVKTSIQVKTSVTFLSIQTKKDHLVMYFQMENEVNEFPVYETTRMSKNRVLHAAVLESPEEVDKRLMNWLKKSYKLAGD